MNEQKQIEKMALTLSEGSCGNECDCIQGDKFNCHLLHSSSVLYSAGYRKQEWISVEERLPEEDGKYLTFAPFERKEGGSINTCWFSVKAHSIFSANSFETICKVTHWMPLPEPPETKGETE